MRTKATPKNRQISKSPMDFEPCIFDGLDPLEVMDYMLPARMVVFARPSTPSMVAKSAPSADTTCLPIASVVVVDTLPPEARDCSSDDKMEGRKMRNRVSAALSRKRQRDVVLSLESTVSCLRAQAQVLEDENRRLRLSVYGELELD